MPSRDEFIEACERAIIAAESAALDACDDESAIGFMAVIVRNDTPVDFEKVKLFTCFAKRPPDHLRRLVCDVSVKMAGEAPGWAEGVREHDTAEGA